MPTTHHLMVLSSMSHLHDLRGVPSATKHGNIQRDNFATAWVSFLQIREPSRGTFEPPASRGAYPGYKHIWLILIHAGFKHTQSRRPLNKNLVYQLETGMAQNTPKQNWRNRFLFGFPLQPAQKGYQHQPPKAPLRPRISLTAVQQLRFLAFADTAPVDDQGVRHPPEPPKQAKGPTPPLLISAVLAWPPKPQQLRGNTTTIFCHRYYIKGIFSLF